LISVAKDKGFKDIIRLVAVCAIITNSIASKAEVDERFAHFEETFDITFIDTDSLPNSLYTEVTITDPDVLYNIFEKTIKAITNDKNPKKALLDFRKIVGDVPVSDFMDLFYFLKKKVKDSHRKVEECYQKYPDYLLFQIHHFFELANEEQKYDPKVFEGFLNDQKQTITNFEANLFFYYYTHVLLANETTGVSTILAYRRFLDTLDCFDDISFKHIDTFIQTAIILNVDKYLKANDYK
jgi:hypothetical protein